MKENMTRIPRHCIIVDTREQRPWFVDPLPPPPWGGIKKHALRAGDYSIEGFEDILTIERKSKADFIGTFTWGFKRFKKELVKLKSYKHACIIIEADIRDTFSTPFGVDLSDRLRRQASTVRRAYGVPVAFAGSRAAAVRLALKLLENWNLNSSKGNQNEK